VTERRPPAPEPGLARHSGTPFERRGEPRHPV